MKKVLLTAIAVSAFAIGTSAQGVSFGPRLGLNFANVSMTDGDADFKKEFNDEAKSRLGLQIGVAANLGITESFSVQPELLFSQQGYKSDFKSSEVIGGQTLTTEGKSSFKANYIQLPVLARYAFGSDDFRVFVNAGPYFGYWMSGSIKSETTSSFMGTTETKETETDIEFDKAKDGEDYNRTDVGLVAGAGLGFGAFEVDVRYNLGLGNTINTEGDDKTKLVNRFLGIGFSYMFGK